MFVEHKAQPRNFYLVLLSSQIVLQHSSRRSMKLPWDFSHLCSSQVHISGSLHNSSSMWAPEFTPSHLNLPKWCSAAIGMVTKQLFIQFKWKEWNLIFVAPEKQALHTQAHPLNDPLIPSFTPHIPTDRNSNIFTLSFFNTTYLLCSPWRPQWTPSPRLTSSPWCLFFVLIKQT